MSLLLLLQSYVLIGATAAAPKVKTEYGIVEGLDEFGCDVFHGVPFAAPPTGPLRWKQPVAPTPWTDVKYTVLAGAMCPQIDLTKGLVLGHEDCLYLSVYSPPQCTAATPPQHRPVPPQLHLVCCSLASRRAMSWKVLAARCW